VKPFKQTEPLKQTEC